MTCAELGLTGAACEHHSLVKGATFVVGVILLLMLVAWIREKN